MKRIADFFKRIVNWIAADGLLHVETSFILTVIFALIVPIIYAALIALAIGFIKEAGDVWVKRCNNWNQALHDIICDVAGVLLGVVICMLWTAILL